MAASQGKTRGKRIKVRLPLPEKGPQVHKDRRHETRKYKARRTAGKKWWAEEE
jgi:hypothetical protein